mmetsp:Transcript_25675/g.41732  ORF Transcript_25675/g.41732 Transcript_25675/m.41732 type:complete len:104 (+) Transcript_25675:297-608(+)
MQYNVHTVNNTQKSYNTYTVNTEKSAKVSDALEAARGDPQRLRALLGHREHWGYTPLHKAAAKGHKAVTQLLLEVGANLDTRDNRGRLHRAAAKGQETAVRLL